MVLRQLGLGVKGVYLRWTTIHEQVDYMLCLGSEMRRLGREWVSSHWRGVRTLLR
jgi:hypothetical protein